MIVAQIRWCRELYVFPCSLSGDAGADADADGSLYFVPLRANVTTIHTND